MSDPAIPTPAEREALNAALLAAGTETGFWDDDGRPAPWPEDIDQWQPATQRTHHRPTPANSPSDQGTLEGPPSHHVLRAGPHALFGVICAG